MNRTARNSLVLAAVSLCATSCLAGPHQLRRTVDDWDNRLYVESPWLDGILHVVPVIPLATAVAFVGDFLVGDAIAFWTDDAWQSSGSGTGFEHFAVKSEDGNMQSLTFPHSGWCWIQID